jgi:uncharacterized protein YndB with AHSA1/START domain
VHGEIVATEVGYRLAFTRDLPASAERVWRMLTDPADRATWLFDGTIEPHLGGAVDLFDSDHHVTGRVTAWNPPSLLALTWSSPDAPQGEVRFELTAITPETCRLRVVHAVGLGARPRSLAAGWHAMLDRLQQGLAGTSSDDCSSFADLVREYRDLPIVGDHRS